MLAVVDVQVELVAYASMIVASIGLVGAVIYYMNDHRNQAQMRKTDLIMRLYDTFMSKEFQEADVKVITLKDQNYAEYKDKYGPYPGEHPMHIAFRSVAAFFEAIGILLQKRLIDIELVYEIFFVDQRWEKLEPIIRDLRKELDNPEYMNKFEYLFEETTNYKQKLTKSDGF
ncbi:MAG: DUF4760 domain-containing protein [Candidatus Hermodarchaeia archaeon]|jgi:hypothetical protein